MTDDPIRAIDRRVTSLETQGAVDAVHREHINKRLSVIETKMEEGFEKIYASLRRPLIVVAGGLILAVVAFIVNGGLVV